MAVRAQGDGRAAPSSAPLVRDVWWKHLLVLLGLTGFAISQPMLSLLGENPTVFTFHGVDGPPLLLFVVALALLPPLALWGLGLACTAVSPRAGQLLHRVFVAVLAGACVIQIAKAAGLEQEVLVAAAGVSGGAVLTWGYVRLAPVGSWLRMTAVLPMLALGGFVLGSPAGDLVGGRASVEEADGGNDLPPVVVIVLDELPTRSILAADGGVDPVRFPHLADLAGDATWYRRYTSLASFTKYAVPTILTGSRPRETEAIWTSYPDNLFSLLAPTHDLVAFETATELCGLDTCTEGAPGTVTQTRRVGALASLTRDLFVERVSPAPNRGERIDTFEEELDVTPTATASDEAVATGGGGGALSTDLTGRLRRVDRFVDALVPREGRPALFYLHLMLPHLPWRFHETGEAYDASLFESPYPFSWTNDQGDWVAALTEQRHLLQAQYADEVVGDVIAELRERDLYDESLVVVLADHGISFETDTPARSLPAEGESNVDALAYSPLFVKLPGQAEGTIDDANLLAIDVLPTIADVLGMEIPFAVDGVAAGSPAVEARGDTKLMYDFGGMAEENAPRGLVEYSDDRPLRAADRWIPPIGPGDDARAGLYEAFGLGHLIGADLRRLVTGDGGTAAIPLLDRLRRTEDGAVPVGLFVGRVTTPAVPGSVVVAAIDDRVVAASPLYAAGGLEQQFALLFPPGTVGTGEVRLALVADGEGTELTLRT